MRTRSQPSLRRPSCVRAPRRCPHFSRLATVVLACALAGCAGSGPGQGGGGGGGGVTSCKKPPPATVSFSQNIQPIFNVSCATSSACHVGPTAGEGLQLTPGVSYGAIVNVPAVEMPKLLLVKPGDPDAIAAIRTWVTECAQNN